MNKNRYLTLGGLFVALHLLFIFLSRMLIGSELILVIFLPLLSTIYALNFKGKEVTMFVVATFLLCVIFEPISTFIYIVPALICGTLYGVLKKKNVKELSLVYITTLSHSISLLIAFLSISLMFKEVDFFSIFNTFIGKTGSEFYACVYLILIVLGLLESFVVHVITNNELIKLGHKELEENKSAPLWMVIGSVASFISYLVLAFIKPLYTCYVFPFLLAFTVPIVIEFILKNTKKWIYIIIAILVMCVLFVLGHTSSILYPGLVIVTVLPILIEKIVTVLYTFLLKYSNNGKNNIE